jgi:hypothetical protein
MAHHDDVSSLSAFRPGALHKTNETAKHAAAQHPQWWRLDHPLLRREVARAACPLPPSLDKLTDFWRLWSSAAMLHGIGFAFSLVGIQPRVPGLMYLYLPFVTPFGTPIIAALLHTLMYWVLLLSLIHAAAQSFAAEGEGRAWEALRLTPMSAVEIIGAKIVGALWASSRLVRSLLLFRGVLLLILPILLAFQHQEGEGRIITGFDLMNGLLFVTQPLIDGFLVCSVAALCGTLIPSRQGARLASYGVSALIVGGLGSLGGIWLMWYSPLNLLGGLLAPFGQWVPFAAAVLRPPSSADGWQWAFATIALYLVVPLLAAFGCLALTRRALLPTR